MSPFFDEFEDQLRRAARERMPRSSESHTGAPAGGPQPSPTSSSDRSGPSGRPDRSGRPGRWAWLRRGMSAVPTLVAVGTTLAIAVAALVLLGGHNRSASPPPAAPAGVSGAYPYTKLLTDWSHAPKQELRVLNQAENAAMRVPACTLAQRIAARGPRQIHATPSRALLSQLAALRRPATAADHLPANALPGPTEAYAGATRLAVRTGAATYYLVPARNDPAAEQPGPACFAAQRAALRRLLPQMPASLRAGTVRLQAEQIAAMQWQRSRPPVDIVCLVVVGHNFGSSYCGENATQLRKGQLPQGSGGGPTVAQVGIAPDGVSTVVLAWATPGHHHVTITAHVHNNVYLASLPPNGAMASMTWVAADGRQLNVIDAHTGSNVTRLCRNRRSAKCIAALALVFSQGVSGYTSYGSASSSSSSATATTSSSP